MRQAIGECLVNRQAFGKPSVVRACLFPQPQSEREAVGWLKPVVLEGAGIPRLVTLRRGEVVERGGNLYVARKCLTFAGYSSQYG